MKKGEKPIEAILAPFVNVHHLNTVADAESAFRASAAAFKGYGAICDSFRCIFIDSVLALNQETSANDPQVSKDFLWVLLRITDSFHWLSAAERQAFDGYPFPALSQLRNIFDSSVVTAAAAQKIVTSAEADGLGPDPSEQDPALVRKRRKQAERRVEDAMLGALSGLSAETRTELAKINDLFDLETHGHRLTATRSHEWLLGKGPLRVLPHFTEFQFGAFLCRHIETMWMIHRLLPLLRLPSLASNAHFKSHWDALDGQFHRSSLGLAEQVGKPIGLAIIEFVTTKFPFSADSRLPL